jgi:hypothetical protein
MTTTRFIGPFILAACCVCVCVRERAAARGLFIEEAADKIKFRPKRKFMDDGRVVVFCFLRRRVLGRLRNWPLFLHFEAWDLYIRRQKCIQGGFVMFRTVQCVNLDCGRGDTKLYYLQQNKQYTCPID